MDTSTDPQAYVAAVLGRLTGPGGDFEITTQDVLGAPTQMMRNDGRSLAQLVTDSTRYGERDYLVTEDRRVSFAEHFAAVRSLAHALHEQYGVGPGDRVAILAANSVEWVESFWAVECLGAVSVGFNSWWSAPEVAYAVVHSTPKVIIVDAKRAELLGEVDVPVLSMEGDIPRLAAEFPGVDLPEILAQPDDPAVILYTSGTSGRPKGAVHSQRNLLAVIDYHRFNDAIVAAFTTGGPAPDPSPLRYLTISPLFHIASLHNIVVPRLVTGSAVVLYTGAFDANRALALIERERITNWGAVPTMANRLIEHGDFQRYDTSSMTAFSLASAPSSIAFKERLRTTVPFAEDSLVDSYGLTECCTGAAVATAADLAEVPDTLGRPVVTVELEIRDPLGERAAEGEEGEVCMRSPFVMLGYWNDPAATAAAIDDERWLHTGDIGVLTDGRLRLTTRRSDLILRGGENIYPTEVEQCVDECPGVAECAVLGAPHTDLGQEVVAVVVTQAPHTLSEGELSAFVATRLAYYKRPVRWYITETPLPRNATGKVKRREVTIDAN